MKHILTFCLIFFCYELSAQLSYLQWTFGMGGPGNSPSYVNEVWSVHVDKNGEVLAGGNAAGTIDLDPSSGSLISTSSSPTIFNGFFARYDSNSNLLRGFVLSGQSDVIVRVVNRDSVGNIFIAGEFINTMDADPGPGVLTLNAVQGSRDMYFAKYDTSGNVLYAFSLGAAVSTDLISDMITDDAGNMYITGAISGIVDFDPGPGQFNLAGTPGNSMYLAKYDNAGQLLWAFMIDANPLPQVGNALAFDPSGNIIVDMVFRGLIDVDPSPATANFAAIGAGDVLVMRYTPQGNFVNAWQIGGPGGVTISESTIACDRAGNILLAGRFNGNLDMDPGINTSILSSSGSSSVFLGRYTLTGQLLWSRLGGLNAIGIEGLGVDSLGSGYILTQNVSSQALMSKVDTSGNVSYNKNLLGTGSGLYSRAIYVREPDAFHIGGGYRGSGIIDGTISGGGSGYSPFLAQFGPCLLPDILSAPGSTDLCENDSLRLTVNAIGTGITYQWYKDNAPLPGDTSASFHIPVADSTYAGVYLCIVTGLCGADTTSAINITVSPNPQVSILINGGQLQALPGGLTQYIWLNSGQPTGFTGPVLPNPQSGFYSVIGINAAGCADTSFTIAITSLIENKDVDALHIYPNPAYGKVKIRVRNPSQTIRNISAYSISGRKVEQVGIDLTGEEAILDVQVLEPGAYVIQVELEEGVYHLPLQVMR